MAYLVYAGRRRAVCEQGEAETRIRDMAEASISDAETEDEFLEARRLFEEYARALDIDLGFQNFARELEQLRVMYVPPRGCLLLARRGEAIVGCVALRPFEDDVCEMKRLYVRPAARGLELGRALAKSVIERARRAGYRRMVLDTLARLKPARSLYRSLGFREVAPYYENPIEGAVYMELDLGENAE